MSWALAPQIIKGACGAGRRAKPRALRRGPVLPARQLVTAGHGWPRLATGTAKQRRLRGGSDRTGPGAAAGVQQAGPGGCWAGPWAGTCWAAREAWAGDGWSRRAACSAATRPLARAAGPRHGCRSRAIRRRAAPRATPKHGCRTASQALLQQTRAPAQPPCRRAPWRRRRAVFGPRMRAGDGAGGAVSWARLGMSSLLLRARARHASCSASRARLDARHV